MDAKAILYDCIYVVIMNRWGSEEGHHYNMGVFRDLEEAKRVAEEEREYRGGKYEWVIEAWSLNKNRRNTSIMNRKYFRIARSEEMGCLTDEEHDRLITPGEPSQEWFDYCKKKDEKQLREDLTQKETFNQQLIKDNLELHEKLKKLENEKS